MGGEAWYQLSHMDIMMYDNHKACIYTYTMHWGVMVVINLSLDIHTIHIENSAPTHYSVGLRHIVPVPI